MKGLDSNHLIKHLYVFLGYILLWVPAWIYSINFETIAGLVSWFLPAGIRISFLLFLPLTFWPAIFAAELLATFYVQTQFAELVFDNHLQAFIHMSLMIVVYMIGVSRYLKQYDAFKMNRVDHLLGLLQWVIVMLALSALIFHLNRPEDIELSPSILFERTLAFMLGDLVGVIAIVIPVSLIKLCLEDLPDSSVVFQVLASTLAVIAIFLLAHVINEDIAIHARTLGLFLFTIIAYHFHSLGAGVSILSVAIIFILADILSIPIGNPIDNQLFLIATSLTTLLVGATIGEQKSLTSRLQQKNDQLTAANSKQRHLAKQLHKNNDILNNINDQLLQTVSDNQELSAKLVKLQETERTQIARELHDQIGQNITAIKVNLTVTKASSDDPEVIKVVKETEQIADSIYSSIQELIQSLHPRVLDELGLKKALSQSKLVQVLENANIRYVCELSGNIDGIDESYAIAIYRIAQEAINNAVKHSYANTLYLKLEVTDQIVHLSIKDNGKGFEPDTNDSGFGLVNIRDRVSALGGTYGLVSNTDGTVHEVKFINH